MPDELTPMHDTVARNEHRCSWCGKRIFKFEAHKSGTFKEDGVYTWRECNRCKDMVSEFFADYDGNEMKCPGRIGARLVSKRS